MRIHILISEIFSRLFKAKDNLAKVRKTIKDVDYEQLSFAQLNALRVNLDFILHDMVRETSDISESILYIEMLMNKKRKAMNKQTIH